MIYFLVTCILSGSAITELFKAQAVQVNRFEAAAGWFMTKNILAKLDYVNQNYKNYSQFNGATPNDLFGGSFKGIMFEAVITF